MKIIFVRHGETEWNKLARFQGSSDIELSEVGREQAKLVGKRLRDIEISAIYSSTFKRAYETALAIRGDRDIEIMKDKRLGEIDFGHWEGMLFEDVKIKYPEEFTIYRQRPHECVIPGEGSLDKARMRAWQALNEIIELYKDSEDNIVIAAHGGIIRLMIFELLNIGTEAFTSFPLYNTAVSVVEVTPERNILKLFNDINHLGLGAEAI